MAENVTESTREISTTEFSDARNVTLPCRVAPSVCLSVMVAEAEDEPEPEIQAEEEKDNYNIKIKVKFKAHVPKFVGKMMEIYGPYEEGDEEELPEIIANILVNKDRAEKLN